MASALQFVEKSQSGIISIERGGVYVALAADFSGGMLVCREEKSLPCRFHRATLCGAAKSVEGVAVAGELAPPSTRLSKILF